MKRGILVFVDAENDSCGSCGCLQADGLCRLFDARPDSGLRRSECLEAERLAGVVRQVTDLSVSFGSVPVRMMGTCDTCRCRCEGLGGVYCTKTRRAGHEMPMGPCYEWEG